MLIGSKYSASNSMIVKQGFLSVYGVTDPPMKLNPMFFLSKTPLTTLNSSL